MRNASAAAVVGPAVLGRDGTAVGVGFVKVRVWVGALTAVDQVPAVLPVVTSAPQPDVVVYVLPARVASPFAIKLVEAVAFCPSCAAHYKANSGFLPTIA